jgi:hypothetical protein
VSDIAFAESPLSPLRRPSQLAPGASPQFGTKNFFIGLSPGVADPPPDEMEHLVDKHPCEFDRCAVENDSPLPEECAGVYFTSWITKPGQILDSNRLSCERRQTAQDRHG